MCTVSFVTSPEGIIITSNRDEKVIRPSAVPPKNYCQNGKNIIYPKDPKAGGTWFVIDENKTVLVLLNGGRTKHVPELFYRKSRGLIALDIISSESPKDFWDQINLEDIEPFTLILYQQERLYELIWDGLIKVKTVLDTGKNHIWSSVTLYPKEIRHKRDNWFVNFLTGKKGVSALEMLNFHRNTEQGDSENGLVINRENVLKTLSITQAVIDKNKCVLRYYDLVKTKDFSSTFISI